jgi:hypothetical protein
MERPRAVASELLTPPLMVGQGADVSVAEPVVDEGEQFAGHGDLGNVAAAAGLDALAIKGDLKAVWRWMASTAAHRTSLLPCLVMCPRRTTVCDSRCVGVKPAHEHRCAGPAKRCTSPISATNTAASTGALHRAAAGSLASPKFLLIARV